MNLAWERIELRTSHAFHIAREQAPQVRRSVWVRVRDGDGTEGWGEAPATRFYGETVDTVEAVLPHLADAVAEAADSDVFALESIEKAVERTVGRNAGAKVAISAALHDLVGKKLGQPVWRLWGLDPVEAPRSSFTVGIDDIETVRQKVREAAGYPILKIKLGSPDDEAILRAVRDEAPDVTLRVDANTAWTAKEAVSALPMLREYRVEFLEQPLPAGDLEGLRLVRRRADLPVIADESCEIAADIPRLVGAVDGVNVKLAKCGSLREALRLIHCARAHGMQVMLGCMIESTLGVAAAVQLAPLVDYVDLDGAALLANDPFTGPGIESDGHLRFNSEPGLGVQRVENG